MHLFMMVLPSTAALELFGAGLSLGLSGWVVAGDTGVFVSSSVSEMVRVVCSCWEGVLAVEIR